MSRHISSEPDPSEPTLSEPTQEMPEVPDDSGAPAAPPPGPSGWSRWVPVIALAIAVIAVAVAVWALLRPPSASTTPAATSQQIADAKGRACSAYTTVRTAVRLQTHLNLGDDPAAVQAVAANARLSMAGGGSYLLARLDPATPPDLAAAVRSFADRLQDIAMNALGGVTNEDPVQATRLKDAEADDKQIADLCR